ncbi:MAG: hypothetical protein WBF59_23450 [Bradyrhizobium sp.]|uniref:hypothetical protein n=1 Tax=Bradyrhizobium sp. TaxID=376 RepID=UPI003C736283
MKLSAPRDETLELEAHWQSIKLKRQTIKRAKTRITASKINHRDQSFSFRLQPELDQPADGNGAPWFIFLSGGPSVDDGHKLIGHPERSNRVVASGWSAAFFR